MLRQNKGCRCLCGPVAQLGARFHGMEEVTGSIPVRSTNQTNNLADSQKKRDTLSIRWFSCCTLRSIFCGFPRSIQKNIDHPALSLPLGWRQSLCIPCLCVNPYPRYALSAGGIQPRTRKISTHRENPIVAS